MSTATTSSNVSPETLKSKAADVASTAADKARQTAYGAYDKARETASDVGDKAKQMACDTGKKVEEATHSVGSGMKTLADTIRQQGPREGMMGAASSSVASGLETGGQYLQDQSLEGVARDLTNLIRRNPIPALLFGFGLGFVLARATVRR